MAVELTDYSIAKVNKNEQAVKVSFRIGQETIAYLDWEVDDIRNFGIALIAASEKARKKIKKI